MPWSVRTCSIFSIAKEKGNRDKESAGGRCIRYHRNNWCQLYKTSNCFHHHRYTAGMDVCASMATGFCVSYQCEWMGVFVVGIGGIVYCCSDGEFSCDKSGGGKSG